MKYLIVSIHDAAPYYLEELKEMTHWLDENAISPRCIKVIPNFHSKWNILEDKEFMEWLLKEKEKGHEIIQHGFTHADSKRQKGIWNRFHSTFVTRHSAEFQRTSYEETKMAVEEGRQILDKAGIQCFGFTPPTWLQSTEASQAIQECGFRYFTSLSSIFDCQKQKNFFSIAIGFQGVNSLLEYLAMAGNSVMRRTGLFCSPLARVVLHPHRIEGSRPFAHTLKDILTLSRTRKLITYYQYINLASNE